VVNQGSFDAIPVIIPDNNLITIHRIGWIIWTYQIIKRTGIIFLKQNPLEYDTQQRVEIADKTRKALKTLGS